MFGYSALNVKHFDWTDNYCIQGKYSSNLAFYVKVLFKSTLVFNQGTYMAVVDKLRQQCKVQPGYRVN